MEMKRIANNKENRMDQVLEEFSKIGIIPVIALKDASDAEPLAKALIDGGLPCAEVTFRTDAAEESIRIMAEKYPQMLVGAGTVLTTEQVDRAVNAGAKFIVSPGINPKVVSYCVKKKIPVMPGCANPSDIELAMELGLDVVKFFPAETNGGLPAIKAMSAPYHKMRFMPTGGINAKNIKSYLDFKKIIACGGSWMVNKDMVKAKDWDGITALTREAVSAMLGFTIRHSGGQFILSGTFIEMMTTHGRGLHGDIAVGVNYVERAVYHLENRGFAFDEASRVYAEDGSLKAVYLKNEIAGFAIHLVQN